MTMSSHEFATELAEIRTELIDQPGGASIARMAQAFDDRHPNMRHEMSADLWWDYLKRKCRQHVKPPKSEQAALPGFGDVPDVVTTYDGEGGFVYKRLRHATVDDLHADEKIQEQNAEAARRSHEVSVDRNHVLIPVMDEHGFAHAGQAIEWLSDTAT